jgi:acyl-coenzyme A synthetase/AMP-(fatty) acid ligase
MAVIDPEGARLPAGELGEIAISIRQGRPAWLFREYLGDPAATAARHRGDWYLTGDIGRMDEQGYVFIGGRADDIINCGGTNIGPWELESVLLGHPAVREVAVVGKPHRVLGEIPRAFIVAEPGATPGEELGATLIRFANELVHPHKALREVTFVSELPKTPEGKLRRAPLRPAGRSGWRLTA